MTAKIRIKMGQVEVEYEGPEDFLRDELRELLAGVVELNRERLSTNEDSGVDDQSSGNGNAAPLQFTGTTNTVAAKLGAKSGTDLIIAALAQRTLIGKHEKTSRAELLKEMQSATSYYKQTYSSNYSKYLKTLISSDQIREVAKDTFSLSATELEKARTKLDS